MKENKLNGKGLLKIHNSCQIVPWWSFLLIILHKKKKLLFSHVRSLKFIHLNIYIKIHSWLIGQLKIQEKKMVDTARAKPPKFNFDWSKLKAHVCKVTSFLRKRGFYIDRSWGESQSFDFLSQSLFYLLPLPNDKESKCFLYPFCYSIFHLCEHFPLSYACLCSKHLCLIPFKRLTFLLCMVCSSESLTELTYKLNLCQTDYNFILMQKLSQKSMA